MSPRRQRDALAPSLFPFLAVLLCTMGALVLILMLIVSAAQASAQQAVTEQQQRREELESNITLSTIAFQKQLEDGRVELEKQRLELQHFEEHILELTEELKKLDDAKKLLAENSGQVKTAELDRKISELEAQLLEAQVELEQQVVDPDGDKPVFAIIPYQGPNGTQRRPIYLECLANGIVIQPENVRLSLEDLRPPHGPGNPLDAALRAIRAEHKPTTLAVSETAYPLLVVRPSGIKSYALARSALSSWDDQFGYELIDQDLELVFPKSLPGLTEKIETAITLAQQRQAALRLAVPNQYRNTQPLSRSNASTGYATGGRASAGGTGTALGSSGTSSENFGGSGNGLATGESQSVAGSNFPAETSIGSSFDGSGDFPALPGASENPTASTGPYPPLASTSLSDGNAGLGAELGAGQGGGDGTGTEGNAEGNTNGTSNEETTGSATDSASSDFAQSGGGAGGYTRPGMMSSPEMDPTQTSADAPPSPQLNLDLDLSNTQNTQPVASQRGAGWAWSPGRNSRTAVVRAIRLQCYDDRWELLADRGMKQNPISIEYRGTPEQRAEELARQIQRRVDSWGIALAGGYWKPALIVELRTRTTWRFAELERLMQDSGIEVHLKSAGTANRPSQGGSRR